MKGPCFGLLLVGIVAGGLNGAHAESVLLDGVAAHVNAATITVGDVLALVEPSRRQLSRRYAGPELVARLRDAYEEALNTLIEKRLVLDAYDKQDMKLPDWAVDARIGDLIQEMFNGDRAALMSALAKDSLTYDEWRRGMQDQMAATSMRNAHVEQYVSVSPGEVRKYYEANRERYARPAEIHFRMITLKKGSAAESEAKRREAMDVLRRLKDGEDFAAVARAVSQDGKAAQGGDWGWESPGMLRAELAATARALDPGQVSDVVETGDDLYILKLEGRKNASVAPLAEVQPEIERELRRQAIEAAYKAWIGRLKSEAYIKTFKADPF